MNTNADNRLLDVVGHWLPRIEVAGIPSATAKAVIDRAGVWENWLETWCAEGERHATFAEDAWARGYRRTAGESFARASLFFHFGQFMAFEDLDAKAVAAARKAVLYRRAMPLLDPPVELVEAGFQDGVLRACLRLPRTPGRHPLAFIIPGSDSTKEEFPALERHFLDRGIATLSMDGPGQGEGRACGPLRPDFAPAISAVLEGVRDDPRLSGAFALVGMAFGGMLALRAAAAVKPQAVVSINGFFDMGDFWESLPAVYRDNMRFALGVPDVAGQARRFTLANQAPPGLPALILHGGKDGIFPPSQAEKCANWCESAADLHVFADGNHVCNNIPWLYRPMAADWLSARFDMAGGEG